MSSIERAKKAAGKALLLEKVPIHEQLGPNATRYEQETQEFADLAIRAALDSGELHAADECSNRKEQGITMFCESKFTIPPLNDNEQPQRNHPPLIYQCTLPKGHTLDVDSTKNVHEHVDETGVLRAAWPNSESFLGVTNEALREEVRRLRQTRLKMGDRDNLSVYGSNEATQLVQDAIYERDDLKSKNEIAENRVRVLIDQVTDYDNRIASGELIPRERLVEAGRFFEQEGDVGEASGVLYRLLDKEPVILDVVLDELAVWRAAMKAVGIEIPE